MDILTLLEKKQELETTIMHLVNEFERLVPDVNLRVLRIDIDPHIPKVSYVRRARVIATNILQPVAAERCPECGAVMRCTEGSETCTCCGYTDCPL